jgi:hypothetical protein
MNMTYEEFKKLYANLAPETREDLKKQLGIKDPAPAKPTAEWWKAGYQPEPKVPAWWEAKPAPSTPRSGTPIVPQKIAPQRKIKPRQKHLWKWIIIGYGLIVLSCILPAILKIKF